VFNLPGKSGAARNAGVEVCGNPWNGGCGSSSIALYIYYGGRLIPICMDCWREICKRDIAWSGGVEV
jgi:hypothetical protein